MEVSTPHAQRSTLTVSSIPQVMESGKRHGTTRDDILGCLYFHVREQLQEFSRRMHRFKLNFVLRANDAVALAKDIQSGTVSRLPKRITFDRIECSNITDKNYVGVPRLLEAWGSLLSPTNPHAAILGLFMNWTTSAQVDSNVNLQGELISQYKERYPVCELLTIYFPLSDF